MKKRALGWTVAQLSSQLRPSSNPYNPTETSKAIIVIVNADGEVLAKKIYFKWSTTGGERFEVLQEAGRCLRAIRKAASRGE